MCWVGAGAVLGVGLYFPWSCWVVLGVLGYVHTATLVSDSAAKAQFGGRRNACKPTYVEEPSTQH